MSRLLASLTVFISSACIMVIELVAGRMVAPALGVSLFTWTTVIGVVLGGIGLGNFLGGRIADRYPSRHTLVVLLLLGALVSLSIVFTIEAVSLFFVLPLAWPIVLRFLLVIGLVFFLPTTVLGVSVMVGAFGFLVGASFIGAEWNNATMSGLLLWEPRRWRVFTTKLAGSVSTSIHSPFLVRTCRPPGTFSPLRIVNAP